jgi:hypothetical protein
MKTLSTLTSTCNNAQVTFGDEPKLDLHDYIKESTAIENQIYRFRKQLRCQIGPDLKPISEDGEIIKAKALVPLYEKARDAANKYREDHEGIKTVTGLRIRLGMDGNKMRYFYQPVYVAGSGSRRFNGELLDVSSAFYAYDSSQEEFVEVSGAEPVFQNYYHQVRIDRFEKNNFEPMIHDTSAKGDTKGILFSFQELFTLYHLIYENEVDSKRYCELLGIYNGGANYRRMWPNRWRLKHTLFVKGFGKEIVLSAVMAPVGNLGHLCPPSCSAIAYNVV